MAAGNRWLQAVIVVAIPLVNNSGEAMASESAEFASTFKLDTVEWQGHVWAIRGTDNTIVSWGGPQATNPETGESHWVDGATVTDLGDLVLQAQGVNGGVELISEKSLGYGTYTFRYSGEFDAFHPNTVLGIFTYDWADQVLGDYEAPAGCTEIDFNEISRWGNTTRPRIQGGATMYADADGARFNLAEYPLPSGAVELITIATWEPGLLHIVTTLAEGTVICDATATEHVPSSGAQQLHLNLWTTTANNGHIGATGDTVVFHDFSFKPLE
ncbi:hypothetical protein [Corynebacterium cystitidis]|nr:hypothetical protein [Corynebacterium cystitidis]